MLNNYCEDSLHAAKLESIRIGERDMQRYRVQDGGILEAIREHLDYLDFSPLSC